MSWMAALLKQIVELGSVSESCNVSHLSQQKRQDPLPNFSESEDDDPHHTIGEKSPSLADELSISAPSDNELNELISETDGAKESDDVAKTAKELDLLKTLKADFNEDKGTRSW